MTLKHNRPSRPYKDYSDTEAAKLFRALMLEHYGADKLVTNPDDLVRQIESFDLWGHDHDFGSFGVFGKMDERHILIPAVIAEDFGTFPDLTGKQVLDVGCWSGGLSLLLRALGADVHAVDEVWDNIAQLILLKSAFCLDRIAAVKRSATELGPQFFGLYDYVFCFGVVYHAHDIIGTLRSLARCLKLSGGTLFVESMATGMTGTGVEYRGGKTGAIGPNWWIPSTEALVMMIEDTGLEVVNSSYHIGGRCIIEATNR